MLRISLLLIFLSHRTRTAYVTDMPSFATKLEKLYEKLESLTVAPVEKDKRLSDSTEERLYAKLDKLNAITPEKELTEDDEELLQAMQLSGAMLTADQVDGFVREFQRMKMENNDEKSDRMDGEYNDGDWNDLEDYYPGDDNEDREAEYRDSSSAVPTVLSITPSAITRLDAEAAYRLNSASSPADQLALTNHRPRILDDVMLPATEKASIRRAAMNNMRTVFHASKCLTPQPRWLSVRQLVPAADTVYMPPCVRLHRCMADSGCCYDEHEVCAPVEGKHVAIPFFLHRVQDHGQVPVSRIVFYNHTRCACVPIDSLHASRTVLEDHQSFKVQDSQRESSKERQSDGRPPTEEPKLEQEEESTTTPQLRRCTCPTLFLARLTAEGCNCICEWKDMGRRRNCNFLARGKEHFGLRDRVCIDNGDCTLPACEYGNYNKTTGKCPVRRYKRLRYRRGRIAERFF